MNFTASFGWENDNSWAECGLGTPAFCFIHQYVETDLTDMLWKNCKIILLLTRVAVVAGRKYCSPITDQSSNGEKHVSQNVFAEKKAVIEVLWNLYKVWWSVGVACAVWYHACCTLVTECCVFSWFLWCTLTHPMFSVHTGAWSWATAWLWLALVWLDIALGAAWCLVVGWW